MILELDCGNSFIKWRVITTESAQVVAGGVADSGAAVIDELKGLADICIAHSRLVSVRTDEETESLVLSLEAEYRIAVVRARSAREVAGVRNGYEDYRLLGLDRWLALLGAFHLASRPCLVLDFGTAATSDFVAADGEHLGGFICPGMPLMRSQLRTHTRRIRYDDKAAELALLDLVPGRVTAEAVERGCALMIRGFVHTQLEIARARWGEDFTVFLTGGDAGLVRDLVPDACVVPDLVFVGLGIACPL